MITYDLLTGLLYPDDREATENSRSFVAQGLTADQLTAKLAGHGITRHADDDTGEHTRTGGHQLIWRPSMASAGGAR